MGSSFGNVQLLNKKGKSSEEINQCLLKFIEESGMEDEMVYHHDENSKWITVYGNTLDTFAVDPTIYASRISNFTECPALLSMVFDSDNLYLFVTNIESLIDYVIYSYDEMKLDFSKENWKETFGDYDYAKIAEILQEEDEVFIEDKLAKMFLEFGIKTELSRMGYQVYNELGIEGYKKVE